MSVYNQYRNVAENAVNSANRLSNITANTAIFAQWNGPKVYSIMVGTNDITQGVADATIYANIQSICSAVVSQGANVVVFTLLPSAFVPPTGTFETHRQAINTLIRNGGTCPYVVADAGNDATIGQAGQNSNTTYYTDGTHPTAAGMAIIATYEKTATIAQGLI